MNQLCLSGFRQSSLLDGHQGGLFVRSFPVEVPSCQPSQQRFPQLPEEFGKEIGCLCTAQESQSMKMFSVSLQC